MLLDFLTPPVSRLAADGKISALHPGGILGQLRRPVLLVSRDLCAFSLFEASTLPRARRRQAAKLYARTASPYDISVANLVKSGDDFGIWWWDLERVASLIQTATRASPVLRPETLAQPIGSGWRIVKLEQGYEAQLWRGRGLIASVWSRVSFDKNSWAAFVRLQRAAPPADPSPPPAQALPIAIDSEALSLARAEISREQALGLAAAGFVTVVAAVSLFLAGETLQLSQQTEAVDRETLIIQQSTPQTTATKTLESDRQKLAAYREIEARTSPVSAAGAAIGIVAIHDLTPSAMDAGEETLSLSLPYSSLNIASELIAEFEQSGYFFDVQPRTDVANQVVIFEMKVRKAAPALSAVG